MLRNCLKKFNLPDEALEASEFVKLRPEELDVEGFIRLTQWVNANREE